MALPADIAELCPTVRAVDLTRPHRIHILGIGGAGMRAIARVLNDMGHSVSGTDRAASRHLDELARVGVNVAVGHDQPLPSVDFVTRSTAVRDDNPEVVAALAQGTPVLGRAEILAAIAARQPSILVAGTHGKTTTSSMLAVVLQAADQLPSFIVGSDITGLETGARWAPDTNMVIEADESDGTFLALAGAHGIVTSLDPDHLEYYGSQDRLRRAFVGFVEGVEGVTAICRDDPDTEPLLGLAGVTTYGQHPDSDLRISDIEVQRLTTRFRLEWRGSDLGGFSVGLAGTHNALNAAGAALVALELGISPATVRAGLSRYRGVARRFEQRGFGGGVTFVDDYAHLPAEVEAAISTALAGGWRRVIAAYQPHRFSRTAELAHTFAHSFAGVDHLVLCGIYPAGETPRPGVSGRLVFDAVRAAQPDLALSYAEDLDQAGITLEALLAPGDLCLTLGAGDLTNVPTRIRGNVAQRAVDRVRSELSVSTLTIDGPLGERTTYRVGGPASVLAEVGSLSDLERVVGASSELGRDLVVIGLGSNMLVADAGFDGLAVLLTGDFELIEMHETDPDGDRPQDERDLTLVTCGAAVPLPTLARRATAMGLTGMEWAVGVPGTVGGGVAMNAGGHGSDMAASLVSARILDTVTGQIETWSNHDLDFGYRTSAVSPHHIVVQATFGLASADLPGAPDGRQALSEIVRWRRANQPGGQNAGSVFTNPEGDSAGRLLDVAGAKGLRIGSAMISHKHANFIQADPDGLASDVVKVMTAAAAIVAESFGVTLVPETRLVGFDGDGELRKSANEPDPNRGMHS